MDFFNKHEATKTLFYISLRPNAKPAYGLQSDCIALRRLVRWSGECLGLEREVNLTNNKASWRLHLAGSDEPNSRYCGS